MPPLFCNVPSNTRNVYKSFLKISAPVCLAPKEDIAAAFGNAVRPAHLLRAARVCRHGTAKWRGGVSAINTIYHIGSRRYDLFRNRTAMKL
jgi:hypothetical protein